MRCDVIPSCAHVGCDGGGVRVAACGRGGIRTAGEAGQRQPAAEHRRVRRAVLRVHYHVDDGVHARARIQQQVARYVEYCNTNIVIFKV